MSIWSDAYLDQLSADAEENILREVPCLFHRFYLETTAGTSAYTLPDKVVTILRINWRGIKLDEISWLDMQDMLQGVSTSSLETSESRPKFWARNPSGVYDIKFYPTPNESLDDTEDTNHDPYSPLENEARCTVSCFRDVDLTDETATLPSYIERRTKKAYVLWRAFLKEGAGQNLAAANYYMGKYNFLIEQFTAINEGVFIAKQYSLSNSALTRLGRRPAKPSLPPNFEQVRY